ncbi:toll/interleukin-1 receptor domain-containing protein [Adlercreutzia equolifaciens]|mgnify:FL=1|uniref:toll/interleukin-1 receptor domain-containing protein n=1 Tax=Adlercreutzia equolifaciens TaxID=446660 RepID=UPI0032C07034
MQRAIEEYRLPRHVVQADAAAQATSHADSMSIETSASNSNAHTEQPRKTPRSPKLGKCFRDEDELAASHSLPNSIREALAASRTLIVICSPETQESPWVRREIEMFEQLHGRERIICVLAAGSSEESIPPILKTRMMSDANGILREMPAEPLAADLRPEAKAKRKAELLRIIAAVAGCNYDDLRQRERIRKRKRIALSSAAAALAIVAIGVFAFQFHRTSEAALIAESKTLAAASSVQFEQGNRIQAIQTALEALPTSEADHSRPLVPEAQAALERALLVNPDSASPWSPFYNIQAKGDILQFVCLNKLSLICVLDDTGTITIASARSGAPFLTLDLSSYLDDTADFDAEDWSIEATEKSALIAWSCNLDDPLLSLDPGTGILNWAVDNEGANSLAIAEDGATCTTARFEEGSFICKQIDLTDGETLRAVSEDVPEASATKERFPSCLSPDNSHLHLGLDDRIIQASFNDEFARVAALSSRCLPGIFSLKYHENALAVASAQIEGAGGITGFLSPWQVNTYFIGKDPWVASGTCDMNVIGPNNQWKALLDTPQICGFIEDENTTSVVCAAGRTFIVFDLATGEILYQKELSSVIVGLSVDYSNDIPFLPIATADGVLDVQTPSAAQDILGLTNRTGTNYYFKEAIFHRQDGIMLAIVHPIDPQDQLIVYLLDSRKDDPVHLSLDELIERGRKEVKRYEAFELNGAPHPL